jgi:hypothetical protein
MKFTAAVLALAAGASAFKNVTYTTEVVTAVTTFCPVATEVEVGGSTYTVTEVRRQSLPTTGTAEMPTSESKNDNSNALANLSLPTGHHPDHHQLPGRLHRCAPDHHRLVSDLPLLVSVLQASRKIPE